MIEVKNNHKHTNFGGWLNEFRSKWEDPKFLKSFTPSIKKKRISKHLELADWIPLYIGKSKNIQTRVKNHVYKELHKPTYAMKLLARGNLSEYTFRLSTIRLDVSNYDMILPMIENQLRNRLNPIIGKQ